MFEQKLSEINPIIIWLNYYRSFLWTFDLHAKIEINFELHAKIQMKFD